MALKAASRPHSAADFLSSRFGRSVRLEKHRHRKGDDCSEADPPRKFHHRKPSRLRVEVVSRAADDMRDVVGQALAMAKT
jgi:hypothetical protein